MPFNTRVPHTHTDWDAAYTACAEQGWPPNPGEEPDVELRPLIGALGVAYETQKGDPDAVRATLVAAAERHGDAWTIGELTEVASAYTVRMHDGWTQLARDYLDDHYPGLPVEWLRDLDEIGRQVARTSEQYIVLDGELFIFDRP